MRNDLDWRIGWIELQTAKIARRADRLTNLIGATNQNILINANQNPFASATTSGSLDGYIKGCISLGVSGATVSAIQGGVTIATTTSDGAGYYSFSSLPSGSTTVHVVPISRFATPTDQVVTVPVGSNVTAPTFYLTAATGYTCVTNCNEPAANTLTLTDSNGTHTGLLVYNATANAWLGCYVKVGVAGQINSGGSCAASAVSCPIAYSLSTSLVLEAYYPSCDLTNNAPTTGSCPRGAGFANEGSVLVSGATIVCPTAFSWSKSLVLPGNVGTWYGVLVNGTVTITE